MTTTCCATRTLNDGPSLLTAPFLALSVTTSAAAASVPFAAPLATTPFPTLKAISVASSTRLAAPSFTRSLLAAKAHSVGPPRTSSDSGVKTAAQFAGPSTLTLKWMTTARQSAAIRAAVTVGAAAAPAASTKATEGNLRCSSVVYANKMEISWPRTRMTWHTC